MLHRQQVVCTFQYPFFLVGPLAVGAAPVAAGVVVHLYVATAGACRGMAAELPGTAGEYVMDKAQLLWACGGFLMYAAENCCITSAMVAIMAFPICPAD